MDNFVRLNLGSVSQSLATWLLFCLFLLMTSVLGAGSLPIFAPGNASINVLEHAEVFRDPSGELGVDQVAPLVQAGAAFSPLGSDHLRAGFSHDVFWLRFTLVGSGTGPERLLLVAWPPFIDQIDLFSEASPGQWRVQRAGDHVPVSERALPVPETIFPVVLGPDPVDYLLRLETRSVVTLSLELRHADVHAGEAVARWIRHGVFLGMSLTAMLMAILAAIWLRQRVFIFAAAYLLCFFSFQFMVNGNDQLFLYPDRPWLSDRLLGVFGCAAAALMAWFVTSYLDSRERFPGLTRLLKGLGLILGVVAVVSLFGGYHRIAPGVLVLVLMMVVAMLALLIGMVRHARVRALAMLVMFLPVMAATLFQILHSGGWLGSSVQGCYFWDMAALAQMPFAIVAILIRMRESQHDLARAAGYQLLVENQADLVVKVDLEGRFMFVSRSYCRMFGKEAEELIGRKFLPLVHEDDVENTFKAFQASMVPPFASYCEQRAWTTHGWRWLAWSDTAVLDDEGRPEAVVGVGRDVTDRVEAESALSRSRRQLEMALDVARIGCYTVNTEAGTIMADQRCAALLGHDPENFSLDWPTWKALLHPDDRERVVGLTEERILARGEAMEMEYRIRHCDGSWRWWLDRVTGVNANGDKHRMLGLVQDITERKHAAEKLEYLARHDELTGLFNRRGVIEIARHQFAQARRAALPCCFAIADLDRFKRINDTYGHEVGDRMLRHIAERLRGAIRSGDWVGRWGGEEFLLVLPQTPLDEAREALERVREAVIHAPLAVNGKELSMTISIGVAEAEPDDSGPDPVIVRADASLYAAKQAGRNRVVAV